MIYEKPNQRLIIKIIYPDSDQQQKQESAGQNFSDRFAYQRQNFSDSEEDYKQEEKEDGQQVLAQRQCQDQNNYDPDTIFKQLKNATKNVRNVVQKIFVDDEQFQDDNKHEIQGRLNRNVDFFDQIDQQDMDIQKVRIQMKKQFQNQLQMTRTMKEHFKNQERTPQIQFLIRMKEEEQKALIYYRDQKSLLKRQIHTFQFFLDVIDEYLEHQGIPLFEFLINCAMIINIRSLSMKYQPLSEWIRDKGGEADPQILENLMTANQIFAQCISIEKYELNILEKYLNQQSEKRQSPNFQYPSEKEIQKVLTQIIEAGEIELIKSMCKKIIKIKPPPFQIEEQIFGI